MRIRLIFKLSFAKSIKTAKVLDLGCGVGRHLGFLGGLLPHADLRGVDINPVLLDYCRGKFPRSRFCSSLVEDQDTDYDLVLLLGGNLGMFVSEEILVRALRNIRQKLRKGGLIFVESNPKGGHSCQPVELTFKYKDASSNFRWGFYSPDCAKRAIERAGFTHLETVPSLAGLEASGE